MLLRNLDTAVGLVNGARGIVLEFVKGDGISTAFKRLPVVRFLTVVGDKKTAVDIIVKEEVR